MTLMELSEQVPLRWQLSRDLCDEKEPPTGEAVGMVFQAGGQQGHRPGRGEERGTFRDQRRGRRGWGAGAADHRSRPPL